MSLFVSIVAVGWSAASPPSERTREVAHDPGPQAIVGGTEVEPGAWPGVVAVETDKLCTGTLVAPDLVLTAAHCFDPAPNASVRISFGDALDGGQVVAASEWQRHPDFCLPADCTDDLHDFAWVRLATPVNSSAFPPIVPITDQVEFDEVMRVGTSLQFVGYGQDDDGQLGVKREVEASLTGFDASGREFRAGGDGKDTCYGDSGGPALVQLDSGVWRLAGVISRGGECGHGGIYGVPLPELCWLRDSSGVDLLPSGCEACDCVTLVGEATDDGCGCSLARGRAGASSPGDEGRPWPWLALELGVVLAAFGLALRRTVRSRAR